MKAGYKIYYAANFIYFDYIEVCNYNQTNEIAIFFLDSIIEKEKFKYSIGKWKIKWKKKCQRQ